jgi:rod shape-determining protein MreC
MLLAVTATAVVFLLLYLMQNTGWGQSDMVGAGKPLREIAWPIQRAVGIAGGGLADFFGYFRDNKELREENAELRKTLDEAEYWLQQTREIREENRRLGEMLQFKTNHDRVFDLVAARIIGRDTDNWNQTVILDQGSRVGLACDMAVIAPAGMVGRIVAVTPHTAEVLLLIDRESAIGVQVSETRFTPGLVAGSGRDDLLELQRVSNEAEMAAGQTVITSGYGSIFPKGLVVGTIELVEADPNGLTKRATIRPAVDFRRLEEVMVIRAELSGGEAPTGDGASEGGEAPTGGGAPEGGDGDADL